MPESDTESESNDSTSTVKGVDNSSDHAFHFNESLDKTPSLTGDLPSRRRCQSTPPWSITDINRKFFTVGVHLPYLPDEIKEKEGIEEYDVRQEVPRGGVYELPIAKTRVETWINTVDVDRLVSFMDRARRCVPVPGVVDWGQSKDCTMRFITTAIREKTCSLWEVVQHNGEGCLDLIWPQIAEAINRLGARELWHSGLFPFHIQIDSRWNIRDVRGWGYCREQRGPLQTTRSFRSVGYSRLASPPGSGVVGGTKNWRLPQEHFRRLEFLDLACAPWEPATPSCIKPDGCHSKLSKAAIKDAGRNLPVKLSDYSDKETQRVVILCGNRFRFVNSLVKATLSGELKQAKIPLIIASRPWILDFTHPLRIVILEKAQQMLKCGQDDPFLSDLVAETIIGARPDIILLIGWEQPLSKLFWTYNNALPRVIGTDFIHTAVVGLTDSTMEEFPGDINSTYEFWGRNRHDWRPASGRVTLTATMYRANDYGPVLRRLIDMERSEELKDFKSRLLSEQLNVVRRILKLTRSTRREPWVTKDGKDLSQGFQVYNAVS